VCSYILRSSKQFYCSGLVGGMIELFHKCLDFLGVLNPVQENKEEKYVS